VECGRLPRLRNSDDARAVRAGNTPAVTERPHYSVLAERDDENIWFIWMPDLRLAAQALRHEDVDRKARDRIATELDIASDSFDLDHQTVTE
jgi:hypothetical protein